MSMADETATEADLVTQLEGELELVQASIADLRVQFAEAEAEIDSLKKAKGRKAIPEDVQRFMRRAATSHAGHTKVFQAAQRLVAAYEIPHTFE